MALGGFFLVQRGYKVTVIALLASLRQNCDSVNKLRIFPDSLPALRGLSPSSPGS